MSVFQRLGGVAAPFKVTGADYSKVCYQWHAGRCNRSNCRFLHPSLPTRTQPEKTNTTTAVSANPKKKVCRYWIGGRCKFGDNCKFLHSWSLGDGFSLLIQLDGHHNSVTGIAIASDKLFTGCEDGTVRVWDCQSGRCEFAVDLKGAVSCLISEGKWVFVGLLDLVRVWNTETFGEQSLPRPRGQVLSLAVTDNGLLLAGDQSGAISAWKFNPETEYFEEAAVLEGHSGAVVSLVVGNSFLYSSSTDKTIRQWNLETLQSTQILKGHGSTVASILCWSEFLLSCSLDNTIKVWGTAESGDLAVVYTHKEEDGVISLTGMLDPSGKPMLLCSCMDNMVRIYELPSFADKGRIFSKEKIISGVHGGPAGGGLFFTGDGTGMLKVWKWIESSAEKCSDS